MQIKNEAHWNEIVELYKSDDYMARISEFANDWATEMEKRLAYGAIPDDAFFTQHATECERIADYDGITGWMFNRAVLILAECWEYGQALAHWHNNTHLPPEQAAQANKNGQIVNTSILTFPADE